MSVARRLIALALQTTWNSERERLDREQIDRDRRSRSQDLRDRNVLHEVDEANRRLHQTIARLERDNAALRGRLAELEGQAVAALRQVADRSEAWRRTAETLSAASSPSPDAGNRFDERALCDQVEASSQDIDIDQAWRDRRDAFIAERLAPTTEAPSAGRTGKA